MNNNDILRQLHTALATGYPEMIEIFRLSGCTMNQSTLSLLLKKEEDDDFIPCSNPLLSFFLEGLIVHRRGRRETGEPPPKPDASLNNNAILKKLRIAFDLKEDDMLAVFKSAGVTVSKAELGALFRTKGNKHYKECSDRFLQNFLHGLAVRCKAQPAGQAA